MPVDPAHPEIDPHVLGEWRLAPVEFVGGRRNHHWRVEREGEPAVLRRYAAMQGDINYELEVLHRLRGSGWPVPKLLEQPAVFGSAYWGLFSLLPGAPTTRTGSAEERTRGRLLAELHNATASLADLGQRDGFQRTDTIITDPALVTAVRSYERIRPDVGGLMRWHIDRACARLAALGLVGAEQIVLHSDFAPWNLLFESDVLSGVLDFESTHLDFRVADFALSWRGAYDDVVHGYEDVHPLSELDRQLLVPIFWGWLFLGVKEEIEAMISGQRPGHGFDWQVKQLTRRSPLFGDMAEPYAR